MTRLAFLCCNRAFKPQAQQQATVIGTATVAPLIATVALLIATVAPFGEHRLCAAVHRQGTCLPVASSIHMPV